jgi:hypothetical protein
MQLRQGSDEANGSSSDGRGKEQTGVAPHGSARRRDVTRGAHYNDRRRDDDDGDAVVAMYSADAMFDQCAATVVG